MMEASPVHRRPRNGFSLIEVLVAVALLAVILLALFSLVSIGVQRAYSGKKMTQASIVAQAAMERANVYEAHTLLGGTTAGSEVTQTWTKTGTADADVTPAAVNGTSAEAIERDAWRKILKDADLPAEPGKPATLKVTVTATPTAPPATTAATFGNAALERVVVELKWYEWGTRERTVRLQSLNLRDKP